jgi:hypothetical protein
MACLDKLAFAQAQCLAAHDTGHVEPVDCADRDKDQEEVSFKRNHEQDHEKNERQCVQRIDEAHHCGIDAPADKTGDRAIRDADNEANEAGHDRNDQGHAHAEHRAHEKIAPEVVRAEQVQVE